MSAYPPKAPQDHAVPPLFSPCAGVDPALAAWVLEHSPDMALVTDNAGHILSINPAWTRLLGWTAAEVVGRLMREMAHPDDLAAVIACREQLRSAGAAVYKARIAMKGGGWCWIEGHATMTADGCLVGVMRDITESQGSRAALEQQNAMQAVLANASGVALWTLDPATMCFAWSHELSKLAQAIGTEIDDVATLQGLVHPDDWHLVETRLGQALQGGGEGEIEYRIRRQAGGFLTFCSTWQTSPHPEGGFIIHGLSQDISAQAAVRDAALDAEYEARQMIEDAPFATALIDPAFCYVVVSKAWRSMFGMPVDLEFRGRPFATIQSGRTRKRLHGALTRVMAGDTVDREEDHIADVDGDFLTLRWQARPWRDRSGAVRGVIVHATDITALVNSRRAARASAQRLKLALRAASAGVFEVDHTRREVWNSREFAALKGGDLTFDEARGGWNNIHPDDRAQVAKRIATWDGRPGQPLEARLVVDGAARWLRLHLQTLRDSHGHVRKTVGLILDIDAQKTQELDLVDAQRRATVATEAKSQFLANISHEIRTPMNGVLGVLQLLDRERLSDHDRALVDEALVSGHLLTELLDDLLDFSRIETGQFELSPEPVDPAAVLVGLTSLLEPAASAKGLTLTAVAAPNLGFINADPLRLRQALYNLMGNAVKFTPSGSVEVRLFRKDTPGGPMLRFEVQDSGVGVPEAAQATLFERFEQADGSASRKFGGSGLGLAITKRLAEMMGGSVGFASVPGAGSTFWIEIASEAVEAPEAPAGQDGIGAFKVLLVEDNPTNRLVITKLLQALGVTVETAEDGEQGVAAAARGGYDLVLMDIQMPGMDGMEATRRIRALGGAIAETPVVAITANVLAHQRTSYAEAGMNGVVSKPVSAAALFSEIVRVTDRAA